MVLARILGPLVIAALRAWFSCPEAGASGWFGAPAAPGRATARVSSRTARSPRSRPKRASWGPAPAGRPTGLVGAPPRSFLTGRRLALVTDDTLEGIAGRVRHGSASVASDTCKRAYVLNPQEHRTRAA